MIKYVWIFITISVLTNVIHFLLYINMLKPRIGIYDENGPIENLTYGFFLLTFLLGLFLLRNPRMKEKFTRKWVLFLVIIGLLGFLEEISFGLNWLGPFGYERPRLGGFKIDAIHDFIGLGYKHGGVFSLIIIIPVALLISAIHYRKKIWESVSIKRYHSLYLLMSFFVTLVFASIIIDLEIIVLPNGMRSSLVEEILELNAALALLFYLFSVYKIHTPK